MGGSLGCKSCHQCHQCSQCVSGPCSRLVQPAHLITKDGNATPLQHYPIPGTEVASEHHVCGDFDELMRPEDTALGALTPCNPVSPLEQKTLEIPNVGCRKTIDELEDECRFNSGKIQKLRHLAETYTHWRPIRGDGNCYYRSVVFGTLETLLLAGDFGRVGQVVHAFQQLHYEVPDEQCEHETLLHDLNPWSSLSQDVMDQTIAMNLLQRIVTDAVMDQAIIRACRRLVRLFLVEHANRLSPNGLTYIELVQALNGAYKTVEDYCKDVVDPMGRDAETLALDALPQQLGVGLRLWILDRRDDVDLVSLDTPGPDGKVDVHVLFKPGHYDLLYPKVM